MAIESSRSSIDGQWIRNNETKEFEYGYSRSEAAKKAYQKIVERLALNKIKNELLFRGMLDAQLRLFEKSGIIISREQLIADINKEVARQQVNYDLDSDIALDVQQPQMQSDIDRLKNNLGSIFESAPIQSQQPINQSTAIPREPAIESVGFSPSPESPVQQPAHTEQEKQEIREQIRKAQEQLAQTLEWAKKQPNEPQFTSTRSYNKEEVPEWTKDRGVSGYREPTLDQVRRGLESYNQQEQQNKDSLINGIIGRMADAGEFSHIPLEDVSQRVDIMNMVKKRLQEKSVDELEIIFNSYANQEEKNETTGMHR